MIGCINNVPNSILYHVNVWFVIELVSTLLLSYIPSPMVRNDKSTLQQSIPAGT
jgi:hypothetical protein